MRRGGRPMALVLLGVLLTTAISGCGGRRDVRTDLPYGSYTVVASWYGSDFHGRPTASGETFDMYARTCAHKQYPFGTRLKVTNEASGRSVVCTVNDRGPFVDGRDLDLSYASAKEIGLIGPGTGPVTIEVAGRERSYVKQVKVDGADRPGPVAIQVGSFAESINAIRLKRALSLRYGNVYIQQAELKGDTYYRVRIGNYESITGAMPTAEQLGEEGYPAVIMRADLKI